MLPPMILGFVYESARCSLYFPGPIILSSGVFHSGSLGLTLSVTFYTPLEANGERCLSYYPGSGDSWTRWFLNGLTGVKTNVDLDFVIVLFLDEILGE